MCPGGGGKGLKESGCGAWEGGWGSWQEKERKASPQADSLESLMIPWLICIGHPAVLLWFYPCRVYWGKMVKLCSMMAVGMQWKRLLRLSQTFSIQCRKDY